VHPLRALALGAVASGVVAYTLATAVAVAVASGGSTIEIAVGPVVVLAVERADGDAVTTLGPGLAVIALAGGILNAAAAVVVSRWGRRRAR
jgi:hypothetical protein